MATDTLLAQRPARNPPDNAAALAPLIELRHVSKSYVSEDGGSPVTVLDDISLEVREGRDARAARAVGFGQVDDSCD